MAAATTAVRLHDMIHLSLVAPAGPPSGGTLAMRSDFSISALRAWRQLDLDLAVRLAAELLAIAR